MTVETLSKELTLADYTSIVNERLLVLREAQSLWQATSFEQRVTYLARLRELLSAKSGDYARIIALENGKTELEALSQEIIPLLDTIEYLEKNTHKILKDESANVVTKQFYFKGKDNYYYHQPYGVIGILGTWNYPLILNMSQMLFALMAGNAVILKTSELSERVTEAIKELLIEAGFPKDLFYCFFGGVEAGKALCIAECDKYILTGSQQTGRAVAKALGQTLKPSIMELSGVDPYVILSDADWPLAIKTLLWASFQYSGQTCVAPRRVLIQSKDKALFLAEFKKAWDACGDFIDNQGILRSQAVAQDQKQKLNTLLQKGARVEFGDSHMDAESKYFPPQVLSGVTMVALESMDFMAPIFFILECKDDADIIKTANQSQYALGASVWTASAERAENLARHILAGQLWVNDSIFSVALGCVPFGGFKSSGFGKTRGRDGLLEMTQKKFVSFDWRKKRLLKHLPPYEDQGFAILNQIQRMLYQSNWLKKITACMTLVKTIIFQKPKRK
ncbi:MAG: acyl-CoA reductase-like NAD-dependent aldehyde dehydrogenase [Candidatus Omnitrophota bacterium]|jgi:acyl-CoA reductase-like NAD-dependent aldehyde dehydrogenase